MPRCLSKQKLTVFLLSISVCVPTLPSQAREPKVMGDIRPWINTQRIALDPKLLTTEDLDQIDPLAGMEDDPRAEPSPNKNKTAPISVIDKSGPRSTLESMYANRSVDDLHQFGYELFKKAPQPKGKGDERLPAGAVQDNFVLSIGDEVTITLRGQKNIQSKIEINNEGQLLIDDLPPIPAAGRKLGDVKEELSSIIHQYYNTEAYLSLTNIKQVGVLVVGHVAHPGRQTLTAFDSVLDALLAAGGIDKDGTLRQIRLIRDGRTTLIDLYALLVYGSDAADITLRDGDKIIVRPIGPTVAIGGGVKRPGIYEILPALQAHWDQPDTKSQKLSMNDLLDLAGGTLSPARTRYVRMSLTTTGEENVSEIADPMARIFSDGDILTVGRAQEKREGTVELTGDTREAGVHALAETPSLASLLHDDSVMGAKSYPLIGVIERWNESQMAPELIAFSPRQILKGADDKALKSGDVVHLFSREQIFSLKTPPTDADRMIPIATGDTDLEENENAILSDPMRDFLVERSVFIRGAVRHPGAYPIGEGIALDALLAVAGGTTVEASTRDLEISSPSGDKEKARRKIDLATNDPSDIRLRVGDTIRVNQKFRRVEDHHVLLSGEIKNPGTYDLMPGDTLSQLIDRAGGITNDAYPKGAIFSRQSERKREQSRYKSQAQDLELKLAAALQETNDEKKPDPKEITLARDLIAELKHSDALGRITVEADPGVLKAQPQLDILLESGDRIYVPKRPLTVRVVGEVLSPASLQFRTEKLPRDYIDQAGGFTYNADKDRSFVVYPDGSAQPLQVSSWNHSATFIPPGSTIIVPRDPKPYSFIDGAKDLSQILASLATTAIFAEDITNGN